MLLSLEVPGSAVLCIGQVSLCVSTVLGVIKTSLACEVVT